MQRIENGFSEGGGLIPLLDGSTPFRSPQASGKIRLRSWAIHDNILGEPFTNVTMYKYIDIKPDPCREFDIPW
jgi:acetoin utilization protein AcuC